VILTNKSKTIILWGAQIHHGYVSGELAYFDAGIAQDVDILEGNNTRVAIKIPPVVKNMFMPGKAQNVNLEINIPAK
jgi:hypothetical protein